MHPHGADTQAVPDNVAVRVLNREHSITAEVEIPKGGAKACCYHTVATPAATRFLSKTPKSVESRDAVPEGKLELRFEFEPTGKPDIAKGKSTAGRAQFLYQ